MKIDALKNFKKMLQYIVVSSIKTRGLLPENMLLTDTFKHKFLFNN